MEVRPGYKQTEVGVIPEDWRVGTLRGFVAGVIDNRGKTPPLATHGYPLLEVNAIYGANRTPDFAKVTKFVDQHTYEHWFRCGHPSTGDILVATVGTAGASAIIGDQLGCVAQNIVGLRVSPGHNSDFVFQYTQSEPFKSQIRAVLMGAVQPSLKVPHLLGFFISHPTSITEQEAIAGALSDVDALLAKLDALIAKKRDLKQAAMQQLLTGHTRLPGFRGEWRNAVLGNLLIQKATYGIVTAGAFKSAGVPMVRGGDIKGGRIGNDLPLVSEQKSVEYSRTILKRNDVVLALVGYPGEAAKVSLALEGANISRAVGLLRLNEQITPDYLVSYLNSPIGRRMVLAPSAGSAQLVINLSALNRLQFLLPVVPEQTAIAEVLSDMDAELAALTQRRDKTHTLKQGMMQELLTGRIRLV